MQTEIIILSILGFILSSYALSIEKKFKKSKYKPACDINDKISCTKALTSSYAKLFKIKNSILGIFFYILIIVLAITNQIQTIFYLAIAATAGSVFLAYISYFKLKTICIVCTSIYIINILLLIISY